MSPTRTVCSVPGCPNLNPCADHQRQPWAGSTRRARLPNDWRKRRRAVLTRDAFTCQACGGARCGNQRLEVDHITRGDDHSLANPQTLGHLCHSRKTSKEGR